MPVERNTAYERHEFLVRDGVGGAVGGREGEDVAENEEVGESEEGARPVRVLEEDVHGV